MPAPTTSEAFLECVRKSGLVDPEYLDGHVDGLRQDAAFPREPALLAQRLVDDGLLTAFHTGQLLRGKYRGFIIGKYKVLEPLGTGGMGHVFLCEHVLMGHRVAMKLLTGIPEDDIHAVERFFREARAGAMLNHPNLVRAHDIDHDGSYYYLIMDYVDGVSLQELVQRRGPLDPVRAAHYVAQAALGLQHMHDAGLVHRDLKPANLVLERTGRVKILDLGLARFLGDQRDTLTRKYDSHLILGTADYLAPEQAMDSHNADVRSDVYSLGATFYYLLAGRVPFPGKSAAQKIIGHQAQSPDPLPQVRPGVPPALAAVVERMMAKKPEDRYQGPAELAAALQPWASVALDPPRPSEFPPPRQSADRKGSASSIGSKRTPSLGLSAAGLSTARLRGPSTPLSASRLARPALRLSAGRPAVPPARRAARWKAALARGVRWARARWVWLAGAGAGLVALLLVRVLR